MVVIIKKVTDRVVENDYQIHTWAQQKINPRQQGIHCSRDVKDNDVPPFEPYGGPAFSLSLSLSMSGDLR